MQKAPKKRKRSPDYEVGYGRPPKATQFKKGVSGNMQGRPKGTKNIATLFQAIMHERVLITENGKRRKISKVEAALIQLANKAATGDPKSIQTILNISRELGDMKIPESLQAPVRRTFTLRVFEKDLVTGERVRMKPGSTERMDDDEDS